MIDIENQVFNAVATAVRAQYSTAYVTGEYVPIPPRFPCVMLVEMDNSTYTRTVDNMTDENHARVMYSAEVYSNKAPGKKDEAKAIMAIIDTEMQQMGFMRTSNGPFELPNGDTSKYRMAARYTAVVSKEHMVYHK